MLSRRLFSYVPLRRVSVSFGLSASEPPSSSGSPSSASTSTTTTTPAGNVRELPPVTNEAQLQMREEFFRKERQWESRVDLSKLTEDDKVIHEKHRVAAMSLHLSYEDPFTGLKVMSRWRHFSKGGCCGKACRHCVYEHEKVPDERRVQRRFNSAFWEDIPGLQTDNENS